MNMIKIITLAWMLVFSSLAFADEPATNTYEVSINSLRLPGSPNGTVGLRECDTCDYLSIRVTARTLYMINGRHLRLNKFKDRIRELKAQGDITINVTQDDASRTVASVYVYVQ